MLNIQIILSVVVGGLLLLNVILQAKNKIRRINTKHSRNVRSW